MTTESGVTSLAPPAVNAAADVLARAFEDDPVVVWLVPDDQQRSRDLPWAMNLMTRYALKYGQIDTTAGQPEAVALWLPPESPIIGTLRIMCTGMWLAPLKLGFGVFGRYLKWANFSEHLHKRDMPPRHWYLPLIGVDPPHQGKGFGGRLMERALARADADRVPCYLENTKERNLPFYQKHGFEVIVEEKVAEDGPTIWTMKREPVG